MSIFEPIQMNIAREISAIFENVSSDEEYDKAWDRLGHIEQKILAHTFTQKTYKRLALLNE